MAKSTNRSRNGSDLCLRLPHNPEVGGSSPPSATRSVTVVDTISATVIFYLLLFRGCFGDKIRDIPNIFGNKQILRSELLQPWAEKTGLGTMVIVIRIQTINYCFLYIQNRPWPGASLAVDGFSLIPTGQKEQNRTAESFLPPLGLRLTAYGI